MVIIIDEILGITQSLGNHQERGRRAVSAINRSSSSGLSARRCGGRALARRAHWIASATAAPAGARISEQHGLDEDESLINVDALVSQLDPRDGHLLEHVVEHAMRRCGIGDRHTILDRIAEFIMITAHLQPRATAAAALVDSIEPRPLGSNSIACRYCRASPRTRPPASIDVDSLLFLSWWHAWPVCGL